MNCLFVALKSCRHKNQTKITLFTTLGPPYWMFSRISKVGPNRKLVPSIDARKSFGTVWFRHNPGHNHLFGGLLFTHNYGVRERGCVALLKVDRHISDTRFLPLLNAVWTGIQTVAEVEWRLELILVRCLMFVIAWDHALTIVTIIAGYVSEW